MKKVIGGLAAFAVLVAAAPASADAHAWHSCGGGTATIQHKFRGYYHGMYMRTSGLKVRSPMNCASGRYALGVMRRKWQHTPDSGAPPSAYYDGYVLWQGRLVRYLNPCCGGLVRYHENSSDTDFQARVQIWSD